MQLRLDSLGKDSADEMLSALLDGGVELNPLRRLIIGRTEGNPFFMEETVLVLFDEGALVRNGVVKLTRPLHELKIPPTVQDILAARIDRLAPDQKDLAPDAGRDRHGVQTRPGPHDCCEVETGVGADAVRTPARRVHLRAACGRRP